MDAGSSSFFVFGVHGTTREESVVCVDEMEGLRRERVRWKINGQPFGGL